MALAVDAGVTPAVRSSGTVGTGRRASGSGMAAAIPARASAKTAAIWYEGSINERIIFSQVRWERPAEAIRAAQIAKVYCARAGRDICETAVQVHGGIGNTWECLVHVYLRRALASADLFGVRLEEVDCGLS